MVSPEDNSRQARQGLRNMPQTRDAILNLVLIEAGVHFARGKLRSVLPNVESPEAALARVIAQHLREDYL